MISSIILAAGASGRMGSPKALLKIGEKTFLQRIVEILLKQKVANINVVLGAHADEIISSIKHLPVRVVINEQWQNGQLSSLIKGLKEIDEVQTFGALVWPVDHPLVSGIVVGELIDVFKNNTNSIIIPTYKGKRGHPVIFPKNLFNELRTASLDKGARSVVYRHEVIVYEVETNEDVILTNIDTPEEYKRSIKGE